MSIWPPNPSSLNRPAYRSLARSLIDAIDAGEIRPGARLPSHRTLAFELGLSVHTVSRAYEELSRLGYISGEVGRGSFVSTGPADAAVPWHRLQGSEDMIDCSMLAPVTGEIHVERMSQTLAALSQHVAPSVLFSFRPKASLAPHTLHARRWLDTCGLNTQPDLIIPTNGNTAAMTVALMTAAIPGDLVVTEALGHHTLRSLTAALGLRLAGLAIDEEGIVPEAFERACSAGPVKVLYCMPSGLGPTLAFMSEERRAALCEIAAAYNVAIIENDAWGPMDENRPPPLATIAPDRTFYFTGLTKCLLPGLRIAWLVVPEAMISAARTRHLVTNWMATALMAEIATTWIANGTAEALMAWQRKQLARRNAMVSETLSGLPHRAAPHALHIWLPLPEPWQEDAFVAHARANGVAVAASSNFTNGEGPFSPAVRVCVGAGSEAEIAKGLGIIARLARSAPEPALLAV